jgi:protein-disulfide isomerase
MRKLVLFILLALCGIPALAATSPANYSGKSLGNATLDAQMADRVMGSDTAPVTIIEYSSLTCPHCAEFNEKTLPQIKAAYIDTGKVRYISRDFPLDKVALSAAEMARCAPPERYFPLTDLLFKSQANWMRESDSEAAMSSLGRLAGLSESALKACFADQQLQEAIVAERAAGDDKYKIEATPTFIFNEGAAEISGAEPYEKFQATIDGLLAKK